MGRVTANTRNSRSYPYPIFQLLTTQQRVFLFAFSAVLMTGSTVVLKRLYHVLNGGVALGTKEE